MELIIKRNENMLYEEYRVMRSIQQKQIKNYLRRGVLFYKSCELIPKLDNLGNIVRGEFSGKTKGISFVGSVFGRTFKAN
jgi:hypothetical protein